jgi:leader peptidase (prepilin peptidase)/N-methyltransferase
MGASLVDELPGWFVSAFAGLFGLAIGSFLNVLSLRWPQDLSVVTPRSACPGCETPIAWYDNIPVFSWIRLRGRCRTCRNRISLQYPLVELATALVWAGIFAYYGLSVEAVRGALFLTILFGISLSDARFYIIPDQFSVGGAILGLLFSIVPGSELVWTRALLGSAVGYGAMWAVAIGGTWLVEFVRPGRLEEAGVDRALGGGDVKMMAMVGAFLGVWGVVTTVFFGCLFALIVYGPISYLTRRLVPLGIFLAAGAALSYGWGDAVLDWYRTNMLGL